MIKIILIFLVVVILLGGFSYSALSNKKFHAQPSSKETTITKVVTKIRGGDSYPLSIAMMREKAYHGSHLIIEQTLPSGSNYSQYIVSYLSEGLKIYGLLTVPQGQKPIGGWPVILFNHGYIPPASYSTISSYNIMVDPLASAGYIVFKPDYRGNGNSQGSPTQPYTTPDDVTDSMNALVSVEAYKDANPHKIGVFGHSMGGNITLHELIMTNDFKAAELMAGVVGSETALEQWWDHRFTVHSIVGNDLDTYYQFEQMIKDHGTPENDPTFWNAIDPTQFIGSITTPVQIQVGSSDEEVPPTFSSSLRGSLQQKGKVVDYKVYPGADHNLAPDTDSAMAATVAFFNDYVK